MERRCVGGTPYMRNLVMTDDTKETSNEGNQTGVEQPTTSEMNNDVEAEVSPEEPGPLQQTVESVNEDEKILDNMETPPEKAIAQPSEKETSPAFDLQSAASNDSPTLESVIEAVLFATDEPLPESKLAGIVEATAKQVRDCVENLNAKYEANHNAFRIEQIAGGYQMLTQPIYNSWLKKMVKVRSDSKLSPAAMETLAIIAYKQPIIRADIEAIRGVAVGEVIRSLMYKGLVKIAGRAEILGRPMLYGTTKKFLEVFGLNSLKDLPKAEDLKNPDRG